MVLKGLRDEDLYSNKSSMAQVRAIPAARLRADIDSSDLDTNDSWVLLPKLDVNDRRDEGVDGARLCLTL